MPRISDALYARGYSREYADNAEADRHDRMREEEIDRQLEASARLRDAAPELLAALVSIVEHPTEFAEIEDFETMTARMVEKARAAIAKATR